MTACCLTLCCRNMQLVGQAAQASLARPALPAVPVLLATQPLHSHKPWPSTFATVVSRKGLLAVCAFQELLLPLQQQHRCL